MTCVIGLTKEPEANMIRLIRRSSSLIAVFSAIAALVSVGYNIVQQEQINRLRTVGELAKQKESLLNESVNEMIMGRMSELRENISEVSRNTGRVEGMVAASMNIPPEQNQTSAIWHEGYYRGMGQLAIVEESAYISGYHRATEDMGCPASTREKMNNDAAFKYQQDKQIDIESQQFNKALEEAENAVRILSQSRPQNQIPKPPKHLKKNPRHLKRNEFPMAKVTMTFEDMEEGVVLSIDSDPSLPENLNEDTEGLTDAQKMALSMAMMFDKMMNEDDEPEQKSCPFSHQEQAAKPQKKSCCGKKDGCEEHHKKEGTCAKQKPSD
jgi:hypothetical protein